MGSVSAFLSLPSYKELNFELSLPLNFHLTCSYSAVKILRIPNIGEILTCSVNRILVKSHVEFLNQ